MYSGDVIELTRKLLSFDTVNPPGNEGEVATFLGSILSANGFNVVYVPFESGRLSLIADKGLDDAASPVVFTGHFDTVPLGAKSWSSDPFGGEIKDGRLYGRGSSDMKGGLAAMIIAAISSFREGRPRGGVRLVLTAAEELGCHGAKSLVSAWRPGKTRGIIVGEPTSNIPAIGHKGGVYLNITATGVTAHSSMPHLGDNAIYKVARAISRVERFDFGVEPDPLLGLPTINVGTVFGGMNLNSVPDRAGFTIDARTTTNVCHRKLLEELKATLGEDVSIEILVDLPAVSSRESDAFVQEVYRACGIAAGTAGFPKALPYLTDGSVLQSACNGAPVVIMGPGEPAMAHQTDEFCVISKLEQAVELYKRILLNDE